MNYLEYIWYVACEIGERCETLRSPNCITEFDRDHNNEAKPKYYYSPHFQSSALL